MLKTVKLSVFKISVPPVRYQKSPLAPIVNKYLITIQRNFRNICFGLSENVVFFTLITDNCRNCFYVVLGVLAFIKLYKLSHRVPHKNKVTVVEVSHVFHSSTIPPKLHKRWCWQKFQKRAAMVKIFKCDSVCSGSLISFSFNSLLLKFIIAYIKKIYFCYYIKLYLNVECNATVEYLSNTF